MRWTRSFFRFLGCTALLMLLQLPCSAAGQPPYFLADNDGTVGVWDSEQSAWVRDTGVPLDAFSQYDQTLLRKGIALYSRQELAKAMEDFCS